MNQNDTENNVVELNYPASSVGRNLAMRLFDAFVWIFLGMILTIGTLFAIQGNGTYKGWNKRLTQLREESTIYKTVDGKQINIYDYVYQDEEMTLDEKSSVVDSSLTYFFTAFLKEELNGEGSKIYLDYKLEEVDSDGNKLFNPDGSRAVVSDDYDVVYLSAYGNILTDKALGYLNSKPEYLSLKKKTSLCYLIGIPLTFVLSYIIVYYIIPLCFSRGKKTLGMLVTKTALLQVDGMSCKVGRFTLKFLFKMFIILIGSIFGLLIPLAVSITMIVVMKSHQSFSEYVTNTYIVLADEQTVYKDKSEFCLATTYNTEKDVKDIKLK